MAGQPEIPEGQSRFLRESGKNARMQRQYFNRAGEPMYSSLLMALMDRAGLNPMSLLHPQRNQQPRTGSAGPGQGGVGQVAPGPYQGSASPPPGLPSPMPIPQLGGALAGEKSQSPAPGLGMGQPGVMTGAASPTGGSMELTQQPDFTSRLAGVMGGVGGGGPQMMGQRGGGPNVKTWGAGGGNQNGGGLPRLNGGLPRLSANGGGENGSIYQNPDASTMPDPNNIGGSQGWTDQDRMKWQSGVSNINNQFQNLGNRAAFQTGQNLGAGQNSIGAGLQAQLARDQGQAMTGLANQVTMQGIQQEDQRMQMLMQALQPLMGFPAQASQSALGTAAGWGQAQPQQQGGLGGLGALAYLFA